MTHDTTPASSGHVQVHTVDELHAELGWHRGRLDAVRAIVAVDSRGSTDWRRRCEDAAALLRGMFDEAARRPGASETPHVEHLEPQLREILDALEGRTDHGCATGGGAR